MVLSIGRRGPLLGAALLVAAVLLAGPAGAAYLTHGADPGRTGVADGRGPAMLDTVLTVDLPGIRATEAPPVIVDGAAFVMTRPRWFTSLDPDLEYNVSEAAVWRIDLDTGDVRRHVDLSSLRQDGNAMASDGERLFVVTGGDLHAFSIDDGSPAWPAPIALRNVGPAEAAVTNCEAPVVVEGRLFAACVAAYGREEEPGGSYWAGIQFAVAVDVGTGAIGWTWVRDGLRLEGLAAYSDGYWIPRLAVAGGRVVVATLEVDDVREGTCPRDTPWVWHRPHVEVLWGLDAASGAVEWASFVDYNDAWPFATPGGIVATRAGMELPPRSAFAAREDLVVFVGRVLHLIDPATGCSINDFSWLGDDAEVANTARDEAVVLAGDDAFIKAKGQLGRYSISNRDWAWRAGSGWGTIEETGMLLAGGRLFTVQVNGQVVHVDAASGHEGPTVSAPLGSPELGNAFLQGVSGELLVVASSSAQVTVLGRTAASIQVVAHVGVPDELPGTARLDLSASTPGFAASTTEYLIDWGDGTTVGWTTESVLEHTYTSGGPFEATVRARNEAGQTTTARVAVASEATTGPLGGTALSWWPLIALVALGGTGAAVVRRRRAEHLTTRTAPARDGIEAYRQALDHALADDGEVAPDRVVLLEGLREKLGITERDHAVMVRTVLAERDGHERPVEVRPGETFLGKYAIERVLGEGGQGVTYLARDTVLEREVVVKLLHPGAADPTTILREARAMARVESDNVVSILEADELAGHVFVVMEHLVGGNLKDLLAAGPLDRDDLSRLARDLLAALAAVHDAGVVHRDVKPANVLLDRTGRAKLSDFGVVHVPGLEVTVAAFRTFEGAVGTVPYMSPEQARGRPAGARSDLYSAALVVYEAATGKAYQEQRRHESPVELQMRIARAAGFKRKLPDPAEALRAWFERALHPDPDERFADAAEMLAAFEEAFV